MLFDELGGNAVIFSPFDLWLAERLLLLAVEMGTEMEMEMIQNKISDTFGYIYSCTLYW